MRLLLREPDTAMMAVTVSAARQTMLASFVRILKWLSSVISDSMDRFNCSDRYHEVLTINECSSPRVGPRHAQGNLQCVTWPVVSVTRYLDVAGSHLLSRHQQSDRAMWKGTLASSDGRAGRAATGRGR